MCVCARARARACSQDVGNLPLVAHLWTEPSPPFSEKRPTPQSWSVVGHQGVSLSSQMQVLRRGVEYPRTCMCQYLFPHFARTEWSCYANGLPVYSMMHHLCVLPLYSKGNWH